MEKEGLGKKNNFFTADVQTANKVLEKRVGTAAVGGRA